jgi:hypothetical protein
MQRAPDTRQKDIDGKTDKDGKNDNALAKSASSRYGEAGIVIGVKVVARGAGD